jgi:WD40 repeat protein
MLNCYLCSNPVESICICSNLLYCKFHNFQHAHQPYCSPLPISSCSSKHSIARKDLNLTDRDLASIVINHSGLRIFNNEHILALVESSDGRYITISSSGILNSWDMENDSIDFVMQHEKNLPSPLSCLALKSSNRLILANSKNEIECIDLTNKRTEFAFTGHKTRIVILKITPNEDALISASDDSSFKLWSIEDRCQMQTIEISDLRLPPYQQKYSLAINQDNRFIALTSSRNDFSTSGNAELNSSSNMVYLCGLYTWDILLSFKSLFCVTDLDFIQMTDYLVCGSIFGIQIYRINTDKTELCFVIPLRSRKVQCVGNLIVSLSEGCINVWNFILHQEISSYFEEASRFIISQDNTKIIIYNTSTKVSVYDLALGTKLKSLERHETIEHTGLISSGDLRFLVTYDKRKLIFWDLEYKRVKWVFNWIYDVFTYIGLSEDNRKACIGLDGKNTMICTIDIDKQEVHRFFAGHGIINDIFMTTDKKYTISVHAGYIFKVFCFHQEILK